MTIRYCFALDLKDDPTLIERYKTHHQPGNVWPEIIESIRDSGIEQMDIFLVGNRLLMIMDVNDSFCFERKAKADLENETVQRWEQLMLNYQQALPWATGDEKWLLMDNIFSL